MIVICNYSKKLYHQKPKGEEVKLIQAELAEPRKVDIQELAELIGSGANFRPAAIKGKEDKGFISQQIFGLDFDNTDRNKQPIEPYLTIEQAHQIALQNGIEPIFAYETFSSKQELPKFRMIFCFDEPIKNLVDRNAIQRYLMGLYGEYTDKSCINPARLFYGTDKGICKANYTAILDSKQILASIPRDTEENSHRRRNTKPQKVYRSKAIVTMDSVEAIRRQDTEYLRNKLARQPIEFDNRQEFYDFLYRDINLAELLEVDEKTNFCCIFHEDHEPSANIYREKYGIWKYKCFGSNCQTEQKALNTKQVIELLGNFDSEYKALEFIKAIYNLSIKKTEWAKEQEANIDEILHSLASNETNSFKELCPTASYNTRNCQSLFMQVLCIARSSIYPERTTEAGNIMFYMSIRQLARAAKKSSIDKVTKYLKLLIYHGLIEIVPDSKVPPAFLKKALEGSINKQNHIQFYSIPSWVFKHLQYIEQQGQKWKENNYRINGISRELFLRTEGVEVANMLYPQTSHFTNKKGEKVQKQTSKKADALHSIIADSILDQIQINGYTTEKELIEVVQAKTYKTRRTIETQIKRSLTDIMNCYGLTKQRANKAIKEHYGIVSNGYPAIIYLEE